MSLEICMVFVVIYHDPGCPEEFCAPSEEVAYIAHNSSEAQSFIENTKARGAWRWEKMNVVEREALMKRALRHQQIVLVDLLPMGAQRGWLAK